MTALNRLPVIVRQHIAGFRALLVFTVLCGLIYPAVMVGVSQLAFRNHANGSMVSFNGRAVGSSLLCQEFADAKGNPLPQYFQPRPSAAVDAASKTDYGCRNPLFSAASNLGPNNADLVKLDQAAAEGHIGVRSRLGVADSAGRGHRVRLGPGPGISPQNAAIQVNRVAAARHLPVSEVQALVDKYTQGRTLGFLGEPAVNVLNLNIALDQLSAKSGG